MRKNLISGKFITLRQMKLSDIPHILNWLSDSEVTRFLELKEYELPAEIQKKKIMHEDNSKDHQVFVIVDRKSNLVIGKCGLHNIDQIRNDAYMRIIIGDKNFWNGRTALESESLLLNFGFNTLSLHKIYGYVHVENIGQRKLVEKVGFKKDGIMRDFYFKERKYSNAIIYSILSYEYKKEIFK